MYYTQGQPTVPGRTVSGMRPHAVWWGIAGGAGAVGLALMAIAASIATSAHPEKSIWTHNPTMYVAYGFLALAVLLGAKALGLLARLRRAAIQFLPSVTVEAPKRRLRIWRRRRYDYKHAGALVSAGRMGERLSQTFDVGEPEIAPNSVSWTLGRKQLPEAPLVVATERDAAIAKIEKWIKRGVAIEKAFTTIKTPKEVEAMSDDGKRTWLRFLGLLSGEEYFQIEQWNHGVIEELREIGGGALSLYSANEKLSRALQMIPLNRAFLRERIEELQAIHARLETPEVVEPSGEAVAQTSLHALAGELIAECSNLIGGIWAGKSELSQAPGSGDIQTANAFLRKLRPILGKHYNEQITRVNHDIPEGSSEAHVAMVLGEVLPALHGFQKRYPA
jgi:hypothetical protein